MTDPGAIERLRRDVRMLKAWAIASTSLLLVFALTAFVMREEGRVQVLDVDRINVRNADGGLALVIAGQGRLPGPTFGGREYAQEYSGGRVQAAGMIFFNERGDEVGGLTFHGDTTAQGHRAGGHFSFDQFRQDQVVAMQYQDDGTSRRAGLNVWDRSTEISIGRVLELIDARANATGAARDSLEAEIQALASSGLGAHRIFLGSQNRSATLLLRDTRGNARIRLHVDSADVARLEFLDSAGAVVRSYPQ